MKLALATFSLSFCGFLIFQSCNKESTTISVQPDTNHSVVVDANLLIDETAPKPDRITKSQIRSGQIPGYKQLTMVMVDQSTWQHDRRYQFADWVNAQNFPPTQVGKRCQYYGKPAVWCLLLTADQANQVVNQFAGTDWPVETKQVRPIRSHQ